jgi:glycosyltransferase involved in cell wall biosynthesis
MRVVVVTTSYPRQQDDPAGSFVAGHVDWLRARGHKVEVLCAGDAAAPHEPWQPGVTISAVPAPAGLFYTGGAPDALDEAWAGGAAPGARAAAGATRFSAHLAARLATRVRRCDHIIAHWLLPGAVAASLAPTRAPITAIAHSGDVHLARRLGLTAPVAALFAARDVRICFVSNHLRRRFLQAVWPGSVRDQLARTSRVAPMGIDTARFFRLRAEREPGHKPPGAPATVLFLGRLVPIKGVEVLLAAIAELERRGNSERSPNPLRVIIAGSGPARADLQRLARALTTSVHFTGEVRGVRRDRLLAEADALVLPSIAVAGDRSEGRPVTALEAMAAGVPVVASQTGGLAELPAQTAALVPPGDASALATAIYRCLTDGPARASQLEAASRYAATQDWDRIGEAITPLYTSIRA